MLWQDLHSQIVEKFPDNSALADQRPIIFIDTGKQLLHCIDSEDNRNKTYAISTAANGVGNRIDSYRTPPGIHRVKYKIGEGEPLGMVFSAREPTGRVSIETDNREADEITSRILWLDGLEPGINNGGDYDSYSRYIYIHGTSDEKRIGQPVSVGCVRMKNRDVIELFEKINVDDLVIIQ